MQCILFIMSEVLLELKEISKTFVAPTLSNVSFKITKGESVALVGANGAGKSTLIKIILGLVRPTAGEGSLFSLPFENSDARTRVGYLPEIPGFWPELSATEVLNFMGQLRNFTREGTKNRVTQLLSALGLSRRGGRAIGGYSKGMLQRTGIAQALLHDPDFLILDEPMSGLDPRAQEKLRTILQSYRSRGKTLLISSHSLEDIRVLCTRVIVLEKSKLVLDGLTEQILKELVEKYRSSEPWDEDPLGEWPVDA